ncbi:hypothetical protein CFN58_05495 [Pseudomonas avellanae]|uniref:Uncharacterized protein n=3 Tax=Pseudomonas syringae group TaxID=136849 RepID=A0A261WM49_9PSED|nr:hypothetical protein CT122_05930 [Pseudomonas syringae pv. actinidiae]NYS39635.1 hypothetical protein [Pseudomonas syringae pv. actinidiae]OZI87195.1 hypothetical protein CFN58_05495 [Pseudomonas avellanae]PIN58027.1 hypothetical protein CUB86_30075 [Pseudomonas syringae pv. actinidiae]
MRKKARNTGEKNRNQERERDLAKAEKRRALEKERSDAHRKKTAELLRSGKLKINRKQPEKGVFSIFSSRLNPPKIRREDVVIDEHTSLKKEPKIYRLEGDIGW